MERRDFLKNVGLFSAGVMFGLPNLKTNIQYYTMKYPCELIKFRTNDNQVFDKVITVKIWRVKSFDDFMLNTKGENVFVHSSGNFGVNEYGTQMNWVRAATFPKEWTPIRFDGEIKYKTI